MPTSTMCICGDMIQMAESGFNAFVPHISRRTGELCIGFHIPSGFFLDPVLLVKEVNMTQAYTDEWFKEMGKRIKARDHANEMAARWLKKAAEAEATIAELSSGTMKTETETAQE